MPDTPTPHTDALGWIERFDSWQNLLQGLNVEGRDAAAATEFVQAPEIPDEILTLLYGFDPFAARVLDLPAGDMVRAGWEVKIKSEREGDGEGALDSEDAAEIADGLASYHARIKASVRLKRALIRGWQYGGAILVVGADDGNLGQLDQPLVEDKIEAVRWLKLFDRRYVTKGAKVTDPKSPDFDEPESYMIAGFTGDDLAKTVKVHASRVLVFGGAPGTEDRRRTLARGSTGSFSGVTGFSTGRGADGWDDSVLQRYFAGLRDFSTAFSWAARLVPTLSVGVYKLKNLAELMRAGKREKIRERFRILAEGKSLINAMIVDADAEGFDWAARTVAGLDGLLDRMGIWICAMTGIPGTVFLGISPGGFGSGEHEADNWQDVVAAKQEEELKPHLERLTKLTLLAKDGPTQGKLPSSWTIKFRPLKRTSPKTEAEVRQLVGAFVAQMVQWNVISEDEAAQSLFGGDEFSLDITLDRVARAAARKAAEEAAKAGPPPGGPPTGTGNPEPPATPQAPRQPPQAPQTPGQPTPPPTPEA